MIDVGRFKIKKHDLKPSPTSKRDYSIGRPHKEIQGRTNNILDI